MISSTQNGPLFVEVRPHQIVFQELKDYEFVDIFSMYSFSYPAFGKGVWKAFNDSVSNTNGRQLVRNVCTISNDSKSKKITITWQNGKRSEFQITDFIFFASLLIRCITLSCLTNEDAHVFFSIQKVLNSLTFEAAEKVIEALNTMEIPSEVQGFIQSLSTKKYINIYLNVGVIEANYYLKRLSNYHSGLQKGQNLNKK